MRYPLVSVVIATYNSGKTLPKVLNSISRQSYPKASIEILVIDGGSKDKTLKIAKDFGCRIIDNPEKGFIPAKYLGILNARSKYAMYIDSDEELENKDSLKIKMSAMKSNKRVRAVITSGYKNPPNFPAINRYINQFGDPFSFFIFGETMNHNFFLGQYKNKYKIVSENKDFAIFDLSRVKRLPLVEVVVMGDLIDLDFLKKNFPQIKKNPVLVSHFFYLLIRKKVLFAITKNDPVIHYSSETLKRYMNKIAWKIMSNIYNKDSADAGFKGRDTYQPVWFRLKKFLFIPYSFSIILPLWDSVVLMVQTRDWIFILHPILCIYTACLIIYHYILKGLGISSKKVEYGV